MRKFQKLMPLILQPQCPLTVLQRHPTFSHFVSVVLTFRRPLSPTQLPISTYKCSLCPGLAIKCHSLLKISDPSGESMRPCRLFSCYCLLSKILACKLLEVWDIYCFVLSSFSDAPNDTQPRASTLHSE